MSEIVFSRVQVEIINQDKVAAVADFAFGSYLAAQTFFDAVTQIQNDIGAGGLVTFNTGQSVDPKTPGGLLAIQIYMDSLNSAYQTMDGLSKLGLNIEKQVWKNI